MKLSCVVHVPERDKGFEEFEVKLKRLEELGYEGVELAIKDPLSCRVQKAREIIINSGLEVSSIDTGAGYIQNGPSLNNVDDEVVRIVAVGKIKEYIKIADMLKSKFVTISTMRGLFGDDPDIREERIACFARSLKECQLFAHRRGITLLLEPLYKEEMDFINTGSDALNFLWEYKFYKISILLDIFHMDKEDKFIAENITVVSSSDFLGHIHIADNNRLAPGQGSLNFGKIFSALKRIDYKGFITVEVIHPSNPSFEEVATQSMNFLRKYIKNARR